MTRRLSPFLSMACWFVFLGLPAMAQVRLKLSKDHFHRHEEIDVAITNAGSKHVSFCVEFGHWSFKSHSSEGINEGLETTPTPVYVQEHSGRKWHTLMIGPDIGSARHEVSLGPGETQHYPFRLSDTGEMRIVLDYWNGERDRACQNPPYRSSVRSQAFRVD